MIPLTFPVRERMRLLCKPANQAGGGGSSAGFSAALQRRQRRDDQTPSSQPSNAAHVPVDHDRHFS